MHGQHDRCSLVEIPIASLRYLDSLRSTGIDENHAQTLAENYELLPPVLVHGPTRRVIDGRHRVRAAELNGAESVTVELLDCSESEAVVVAIQRNIAHGLPLSLPDRRAAARRILGLYPQWSDRAVAAKVGLSHKTVGVVRRLAGGEIPQSTHRLGRDGRTRVQAPATPRPRVTNSAKHVPEKTVRVAQSHGDARRVVTGPDDAGRAPDRQGLYARPFLASARPTSSGAGTTSPRVLSSAEADVESRGPARSLSALRADPSLKFTESGRHLLRLLSANALTPEDWQKIIVDIPRHCTEPIASMADYYSTVWRNLSDQLRHYSAPSSQES